MPYKDLTFLLFAKDMSASRGFEKVAASADGMSASVAGSVTAAGVAVAGLAVLAGAKAVKMAADFQTATTRLVTDAGESQKNLGLVSDGILQIAQSTGSTVKDLTSGMYTIESAGFHGAAGLKVLQAASEGARIGQADLHTVADALTTVLNDYGPAAGSATQATDALIATVSNGKTTMEDLAGSLHSVLPNAQALGISLQDVLGALATMTSEGISADQATQNLNHTIVSLASPTHVQATELAALGLNATTVAAQLGQRGLTGTLNEIEEAILHRMGPAGLVLQNTFTRSQLAAQSARTEFAALPKSVQTVATAYERGTISQKTWTQAVKAMTPENAALAHQWATTENAANAFNASLRSGSGASQTFTAALEKATGGQTGLQVALHLTGDHAATTAKNIDSIGKALRSNGKDVTDWDKTQNTFNQQLAEGGQAATGLGIRIGTFVIPALTGYLKTGNGVIQTLEDFASGQLTVNKIMDIAHGKYGAVLGAVTRLAVGIGQFTATGIRDITLFALRITGIGERIPGEFRAIGANVIHGLVGGITGNEEEVFSAIGGVVSGAVTWAKNLLGIKSPSRVFIEIGENLGKGLEVGITSRVPTTKAAVTALAQQAITAAGNVFGRNRGIENTALGIGELRSQSNGIVASTRSATIGAGNLLNYAATGDAVQGLEALVRNTNRFKNDLKTLSRRGIDDSTFEQLVQGWNSDPATALRVADQLLANPNDMREIVRLQQQVALAGTSLGLNEAGNYSQRITVQTRGLARAEARQPLVVNLNLTGSYAGSKDDLAKTLVNAFRDAVKRGIIPANALAGV